MLPNGSIFRGEVVHKRMRPVEHRLRYRVFSLLMDVDRLEDEARRLKLFSINRFNLFSIKQSQHGNRDGSSLSDFAWQQVRKAGMSERVERIMVLFYPRIFGFAFNPLTVYYCLDREGLPALMIYEVRNTFGQALTYILPAGTDHDGTFTHVIDKCFYVSPFNEVDGRYTFHVIKPEDDLTVGVALKTDEAPLLRTHFKGRRSKLTDRALMKVFAAYPLMTLKVVGAIHWEALKIWRKGMRINTCPEAPEAKIVYGDGTGAIRGVKPTALSAPATTSKAEYATS
ncbi:MAG: DUF1365 domain-containing protein [Pseudomonadota bacterium]